MRAVFFFSPHHHQVQGETDWTELPVWLGLVKGSEEVGPTIDNYDLALERMVKGSGGWNWDYGRPLRIEYPGAVCPSVKMNPLDFMTC